MNKSILNILGIMLILAIGAGIYGAYGLTHHVIQAFDSLTAMSENADYQINRPCKGKGDDPNSCGLIAGTVKTFKKVGDIAVTTQMQVKQTNALVIGATDAIKSTATDISNVSDSASKAFVAVAGTAQQGTATLSEVSTAIKPFPTFLEASTASVNDFDSLLKDKAIRNTIDHVEGISEHVEGITGSVDKMAAHLEKTVDKPCGTGCKVWNVAQVALKTALPFALAVK